MSQHAVIPQNLNQTSSLQREFTSATTTVSWFQAAATFGRPSATTPQA